MRVTRAEPKLLCQPLLPIQLISATLFFLLFALVALPLVTFAPPELAGAVTLAAHAAIRLLTETGRADYRGPSNGWISATGRMALIQGLVAIVALVYDVLAAEHTSRPVAFADWASVFDDGRLNTAAMAAAVGSVVYGIHVEEIGSWIPERGARPSEKERQVGAK